MKRLTDLRLSPATVIACIALFVSLGGVSYGVTTGFIDTREIRDETIRSKDVRNNSLRTQDIRNNEVRGRDIRNSTVISRDVGLNSLTGSDILESSLASVPQADLLDGIDSTGFVPADATGFAAIPFGPSGSIAVGDPPAEFDLDPLGYVHLEGVVNSDGSGQPLLTLPVGARPRAERRFFVIEDDGTPEPTLIQVQTDGDVVPDAAALDLNDEVTLDGVTFKAGG